MSIADLQLFWILAGCHTNCNQSLFVARKLILALKCDSKIRKHSNISPIINQIFRFSVSSAGVRCAVTQCAKKVCQSLSVWTFEPFNRIGQPVNHSDNRTQPHNIRTNGEVAHGVKGFLVQNLPTYTSPTWLDLPLGHRSSPILVSLSQHPPKGEFPLVRVTRWHGLGGGPSFFFLVGTEFERWGAATRIATEVTPSRSAEAMLNCTDLACVLHHHHFYAHLHHLKHHLQDDHDHHGHGHHESHDHHDSGMFLKRSWL